MSNTYYIRVYGVPAPGGSKKGFIVNGRVNIVDTCKRNKPWRDSVAAAVLDVIRQPLTGAIHANFYFLMPRPKSHYGKTGFIKQAFINARHTKKPDRTKLLRSSEDALKGIAWLDDTQVVSGPVAKRYVEDGEQPGLLLSIEELV